MSILTKEERDKWALTLKENNANLDLKIKRSERVMIFAAIVGVFHMILLVFNFTGVPCK